MTKPPNKKALVKLLDGMRATRVVKYVSCEAYNMSPFNARPVDSQVRNNILARSCVTPAHRTVWGLAARFGPTSPDALGCPRTRYLTILLPETQRDDPCPTPEPFCVPPTTSGAERSRGNGSRPPRAAVPSPPPRGPSRKVSDPQALREEVVMHHQHAGNTVGRVVTPRFLEQLEQRVVTKRNVGATGIHELVKLISSRYLCPQPFSSICLSRFAS